MTWRALLLGIALILLQQHLRATWSPIEVTTTYEPHMLTWLIVHAQVNRRTHRRISASILVTRWPYINNQHVYHRRLDKLLRSQRRSAQ